MACRIELNSTDATKARDGLGRVSAYASLQHHVHAGPAIAFFVKENAGLTPIPADTGLLLHVHARLPHLGDLWCVCGPPGLSVDVPRPTLHVYCLTGGGLGGFHYDPLFLRDAIVLVDV